MKDAGCPLAEKQLKAIEKLQPGAEARKKLDKILTEPQRNALEKNENDQRIAMIIRSLEKTDNPITPEQQKKLKAIQPGPDSRDSFREILTPEQQKIIDESFRNRQPRQ